MNTEPAPNGDAAPERFATWTPRQTPVGRDVAQYSRFVVMMKIALPSAAGFLLFLVVLLPQLRDEGDRYRIDTEMSDTPGSQSLSMTNARYYGTDDEGRPYAVAASGVRQRPEDQDSIELASPAAEISMSDGKVLSAKATTGLYNRGQQKLDLSGEVALADQAGYEFRTAAARVDLEQGTASGETPVSGAGPLGTLQAAGGFQVSDRGRTVRFNGRARMVINPAATAGQKSAAPAAPAAGAPR